MGGIITPARLDQRITFQEQATPRTVNARGEDLTPWTDVVTVWAEANPTRGREFVAAQQIQAEGPVAFRIRWCTGLTEAMRVLWRGEPHAIVSPLVDVRGAREALDVYCAKGLRDGD